MRILLQTLSVFALVAVSATSVIACSNRSNAGSKFYVVDPKTLPHNFQIVPKQDQGTKWQSLANYYQNSNLNLNWLVKQNITDRTDEEYQNQIRKKLEETLGAEINYQDPETIKSMTSYINDLDQQLAYKASTSEINDYKSVINNMLEYMRTNWSDAGVFKAPKLDQALDNGGSMWNIPHKIQNLFFNMKWARTATTPANITPPSQSTQILDALSFALAKRQWNVPIQQLFGSTKKFGTDVPARAVALVQVQANFKNGQVSQGLTGLESQLQVGSLWDNQAVAKGNYGSGFWTTNKASSVFTHEFAHSIDYYEGNLNSQIKQNYNKNPLTNPITWPGFTNVVNLKSTNLMHQWVPQVTNLPKNDLLAAILMDWALIPSNYGRNIDPAESFAEAYAYWLLTPIKSINFNNNNWTVNLDKSRLGTAWAFWNNFFLHQYKNVFG